MSINLPYLETLKLNWYFQRGGGVQPKTFLGRGMDILWIHIIIP